MYRKVLVIGGLFLTALSWGFTQGQTASMVGALQQNDDGIILSEMQISLIASLSSLFCILGILYVAAMGENFGRRTCCITGSLPLVINWIILYYARTFEAFILSRVLAGISSGALWVLSAVATAEYTSHKSRGLFLSMVTMVVPAFGIGLGHVLGVLFHWRTLALVGIVLSTVNVFLPCFWVESPHWLASKGRFEECQHAFRKLHGTKSGSTHELQILIQIETNKQKTANQMNTTHISQKLLLAFKKRYFWHLMIMAVFLYAYYTAAGKIVFSNLATVILKEMTGTSDVLMFTFLVDGCIVVGTCISCILIKKMSIRILLFSSGLTANGILMALSACLYFKNSEVYFQWINVVLLSLYFIVIHVGPYPIIEVLLGEMFPLELKLYCFLLTSPLIIGTSFLCVLILPQIVSAMGYHGLFLLNTAIMFLCLAYLYVRMPETKGKTLQEIEVYFKTNSFKINKVLSTGEQIKTLI